MRPDLKALHLPSAALQPRQEPASGGFIPIEKLVSSRPADRLTQRQLDCLLLVQEQLTSKEIARRLGISPHTVDQRARHALRALGCNRRREAANLVAALIGSRGGPGADG